MSSRASAGLVASKPRPVTVLVRKTRSPWRSQHVHAPYPSPRTRSSSTSAVEYQFWGYPMNSMNGARSE
jgi:hypothetical protein